MAAGVLGLVAARMYPRVVLSLFLPYGLIPMLDDHPESRDLAVRRRPRPGRHTERDGLYALRSGVSARSLSSSKRIECDRLQFSAGASSCSTALRWPLVAISLRQGLPGDGFEGDWLVQPRSLALLAIIAISWHLAWWSHGRRGEGFRALMWILAVFASLSRTATAVAVLTALLALMVQLWLTPSRFVRRVPVVAVGTALVALLVLAYGSVFYQRFFEGYTRVEVAGISVSTSGRNRMWALVFDSAMQHPIAGSGLGSSQRALGELVQPHNEYLRVWHDGGIIALALLLFAFIRWLFLLRRQYVWAVRTARSDPAIELAALFTLIGIVLAAITDNGFMYMFVDAPPGS